MAQVSSTTETQIRYPRIKVRTESGRPAKVDQVDTPTAVTTEDGSGVGAVENLGEYTETINGNTTLTVAGQYRAIDCQCINGTGWITTNL